MRGKWGTCACACACAYVSPFAEGGGLPAPLVFSLSVREMGEMGEMGGMWEKGGMRGDEGEMRGNGGKGGGMGGTGGGGDGGNEGEMGGGNGGKWASIWSGCKVCIGHRPCLSPRPLSPTGHSSAISPQSIGAINVPLSVPHPDSLHCLLLWLCGPPAQRALQRYVCVLVSGHGGGGGGCPSSQKQKKVRASFAPRCSPSVWLGGS